MRPAAVVALIVVGVLVGGVGLLRWQVSQKRAERERHALELTRQQARELVRYCDLGSLSGQIEMGTSRLGTYIALDRPRAVRTIDSVVMPSISAHAAACTSAKADLERLQGDAVVGGWVSEQLPRVAAAVDVVERTRAAAEAFANAAKDPQMPADMLMARARAIRAAARPSSTAR
jgi:hypothetical protein